MSPTKDSPGAANPLEASMSISEFCLAEGISKTTFHKMRRLGKGPAEMVMPGTTVTRISHRARLEWQRHMEHLTATSTTIAKRRAKRAATNSKTGKLAAASPHHHCRRASKEA